MTTDRCSEDKLGELRGCLRVYLKQHREGHSGTSSAQEGAGSTRDDSGSSMHTAVRAWPQPRVYASDAVEEGGLSAARVAEICQLVPEGMFDNDIFEEHSEEAYVTQDDGSTRFVEANLSRGTMLMASLAKLCTPGVYAGQVASVAVSETFGIGVNMMHGIDTKARKRMDEGLMEDGNGQEVKGEGVDGVSPTFPKSAISGFV